MSFNAAFLSSLRVAAPGSAIRFIAEPEHLAAVSALVPAADAVHFTTGSIPPRHQGGSRRLLKEAWLVARLLEQAELLDAEQVIFTSVTSGVLLAVHAVRPSFPVLVMHHAALETIATGVRSFFPMVLRLDLAPTLRHMVLSGSIERELLSLMPSLSGRTRVIDHPLVPATLTFTEPATGRLRFGTIGHLDASKGFGALVGLARRFPDQDFTHVGRCLEPLEHVPSNLHFPGRGELLTAERYAIELAHLDYALFVHPSSSYRLSISGAALDAVKYATPILGLRTPGLVHLFEQLGDIGLLAGSMEELTDCIARLIEDGRGKHHAAQRARLVAGQQRFSTEAVGLQLRTVLGGD